jgi:calmodulin
MATREEQRREHNEQKELESLRRVFEQLDRAKTQKIGFKELNDQLIKLDYRAKRVEVEDMIWEVDEDCDHCVSWDEFKLMFNRCRNDRTGLEPRKLFNVVEFMMHDKDSSGTIDMDECMEILFRRFGKDQLEERTNEFFKHDTDGDNAISFAEFQKQMAAIRPKRREAGKPSNGNRSTTSSVSVGGRK